MRIDRLMCFLRFVKTRSLAHRLVDQGHIRRNGMRVTRASLPIEIGDVLTFPIGETIRIVEILALPDRRGPAAEAQICYRALDQAGQSAIAPMFKNLANGDQDKGITLP